MMRTDVIAMGKISPRLSNHVTIFALTGCCSVSIMSYVFSGEMHFNYRYNNK